MRWTFSILHYCNNNCTIQLSKTFQLLIISSFCSFLRNALFDELSSFFTHEALWTRKKNIPQTRFVIFNFTWKHFKNSAIIFLILTQLEHCKKAKWKSYTIKCCQCMKHDEWLRHHRHHWQLAAVNDSTRLPPVMNETRAKYSWWSFRIISRARFILVSSWKREKLLMLLAVGKTLHVTVN